MKQTIILVLMTTFTSVKSQITISEILYEQPSWDTDLQYIELLNISDTTINLSDWTIRGSINLSMIPVELLPNERFVFSSDLLALINHGIIIERGGEWPPNVQISGDPFFIIENSIGEEVVRIDYGSDLDWPVPERGVAIELCDLDLNSNEGLNWALSENSILNNGNELLGTPNDENTCTEIRTSSIEVINSTRLSLFPNPCNSILNINYEGTVESIKVFGITGTQFLEINNANIIDVSSLSAGSYNILIGINGNIYYERIVKL